MSTNRQRGTPRPGQKSAGAACHVDRRNGHQRPRPGRGRKLRKYADTHATYYGRRSGPSPPADLKAVGSLCATTHLYIRWRIMAQGRLQPGGDREDRQALEATGNHVSRGNELAHR